MQKNTLILILLSFSLESNAGATSMDLAFKKIIKKHHFDESSLGLYVEEKENGIVNINAEKLMIPASLTKIVTAGAVLEMLPANKKFVTQLFGKGEIKEGKLSGPLCLKGGGDPSFVSEKMWFLVNEFNRFNIKEIEGDLFVDASRFDQELFDPGRDSVRVDRAYDAPISAMSFNWNSVNIFSRPGEKKGDAVKIFLDPKNDYLKLENKTMTVEKTNIKTLNISRIKDGEKDKVLVSGSLSLDSKENVTYKNISNPALWSGYHLKQFLLEKNILLKGNIKIGECPEGSSLMASVDSKNLNEIISDMLKFSNNFVAEMLVKNLAAEKKEKSASIKEGIELVKNYLDRLSFSRKQYVLENVAGLTRKNRFTAKDLTTILINIKNDFLIFPEFLSALPIAGIDGTMKNRLKNNSENIVRAKTGYLDGVVGLAGYVGRKNKAPLVFTFMFNGNYEDGLRARALFDQLINELEKI